jgi:hypothetical protein
LLLPWKEQNEEHPVHFHHLRQDIFVGGWFLFDQLRE